MKRKTFIILTALVLLLLLTSCPSPPSIMGGRVLMMGDHFMFDQFYDYGYQAWYLNSDGTYERIGKDWDAAADEYVQQWGTKGTYTYDKQTCLLTISPAEGWGWGGDEEYAVIADLYEEQAPEIDSWTMTRSFSYYFTDNGMYEAYMAQPDGSWTYTEFYSSKETEDGTETEYNDWYTRTYDISSTELKYTELNTYKDRDDTTVTNEERYREEGMVRRMAPTDIEWKAGEVVTFYYGPETRVEEVWNSTTDAWDITWDGSDSTSNWDRTFVHLGDFVLRVESASSKDLIIE